MREVREKVDNVIVRVDCVIFDDDSALSTTTSSGSAAANKSRNPVFSLFLFVFFGLFKPLQSLTQLITSSPRRHSLSSNSKDLNFDSDHNNVTHHSPTQVLRNFNEIKLLRIELSSGELGIDEGFLFKWKADFGSTLDNCVILGASSMASNPPPFQVEDNTDEDFFDKLVNDEDDVDFKVVNTSSEMVGPYSANGNESDEAKAFANLSITQVDNDCEFNNDNEEDDNSTSTGVDGLNRKTEKVEKMVVGNVEESISTLQSAKSFEFDSLIHKSENANGDAVVLSNTTVMSKSDGGSGGSGVKEVDWSAFHADLAQKNSQGFGSYSDFFSDLGGDIAGDAFGNVGNGLQIESKVASGNEDVNSSQYWENLYPGWKYDPNTGQWYQVDGYDAGASGQANVDTNLTSDWGQSHGKAEVSYLQQSVQSIAGTVAETATTESVTDWNQVSQVSDITTSTANWNQVLPASNDSTNAVSDWNQASQANNGYPQHMVFYPEYPGWYYDTIAQEWRSLDSHTSSAQPAQAQDQVNQNGYASTDSFSHNNDQKTYSGYDQVNNYASQGFSSQGQDHNWAGSFSNYNQQKSVMWQPETVAKSDSTSQYNRDQQMETQHGQDFIVSGHGSRQRNVDCERESSYFGNASQGQNDFSTSGASQGFVPAGNFSQQFNQPRINQNDHKHVPNDYYSNQSSVNFPQQQLQGQNDFSTSGASQGFVPAGNFSQQFNQPRINQNEHKHVPNDYYSNQSSVNFPQQQLQNSHQFSSAPASGRSSAGRPSHALVTFGFGGKLIVMKDNSSTESSTFGSQNPVGSSISVLNLAEVVNEKDDASSMGMGGCNYFRVLCRQSFPGPLTGGSVGVKELNRWIDERIMNSESPDMDYRKGEVLRLLLSLLKIACQYYGKLRSPFGSDTALKESDVPESAVAKLFSSAKKNGTQFSQYGAVSHCLQQLPSEGQLRATAAEVQSLLVSGRKKEALQYAQEGQLWGPALVLAAQLGDQFYVETVKQMALHQLVAGSPLRTLCLLIAGQPADVFSADSTADSSMIGAVNMPQQPVQFGAKGMLDDWEENLAVVAANRTKDDELVLIHLGDCLWKERSDIIAAHICYLVAEANFEAYSDSARLCLVGADHWKFPRTYASPEAIQRTEIYEYSKMLGNSQFTLLPFQPYKLVYAHMLAEVGRMPDALKYCQAVFKSLKTGRSLEVEALRQLVSSLEERIKAHQQGGFSTNLAPAKLVGKLLNLFDSTAHLVVGGLPPPVPAAGGTGHGTEHHHHLMGPRVSTSQSTMAMSSLIPSQSMESISEGAADGSRMTMHTRSISEPNFGFSPIQGQADSLKGSNSSGEQDKASSAGSTSRFSRFGFGSQLLQKTVGLVLKPRQGRQAKLGEQNKFYYDEKLKRWVEEGAEPPAEEAALPPPPPTSVFQNGTADYNLKSALQGEASHNNGSTEIRSPSGPDHNSGMPPLPPTSNQFSARGRMGVRSRYVDTFNKGGGSPTNLFQSPSVPSAKPASVANPKFFVPTSVPFVEQSNTPANSMQDTSYTNENPSTSSTNDSFQSPAIPSSMAMQRFASMDNISNTETTSGNGSFSAHSRRTASWSGSFNGSSSPPNEAEVKPLGEVLGMHSSSFMPSDSSLVQPGMNGPSFGDDLHEVEL
ncbi:Protein transport protein SEC16B-like protein [Forsythia ovata]|uniref:Protein transport protein sec16 n=1 Tax=Forsythia ovata TaxID=205694 RepID=A0ABD1WD69_9LAMI